MDAAVIDAAEPLIEPTDEDLEVAYEILRRPVAWDTSPVRQVARIVARYRGRLQARQPRAGA